MKCRPQVSTSLKVLHNLTTKPQISIYDPGQNSPFHNSITYSVVQNKLDTFIYKSHFSNWG